MLAQDIYPVYNRINMQKVKKQNDVVSVENFSMVFGKKIAVDNLSFTVKRGETFGFLGSNGSGKTTTLRALLGLYQSTSGNLTINGKKYSPNNGTKLGYLPEERGMYQKERVLDVMMYFGTLKGLPRDQAKKNALKYLAEVEMTKYAKTRIDKLSGGQQQKIQLGITVIDNPDLLILDEPTKGFDPVNRRLLMNIVNERKKLGATVVIVTHQMDEVEKLCDRLILLKNGKTEAYGTIKEVRSKFNNKSLDDIFIQIYQKPLERESK